MEPLRKNDEKFEDRLKDEKAFKDERAFKNEKAQPADISESAEYERERYAELERGQPDDAAYPGTMKPARMSVPMGAAMPKGEAEEPKTGGPRLVSKEPSGQVEAKKGHFFAEKDLQEIRARWEKIQGEFVDQPRQAVEDADNLVGEAIKKLSEQFAEERSTVIKQWNSGDNVSTEVLRQSLRRYRAFFDRLLAA